MTKDEYGDFVLRYKGCGACFPMYHTLSRFEKMWFSAIQKDVAELEKENAELKEKVNILDNCDRLGDVITEAYKDQLTKAKNALKKFVDFANEERTIPIKWITEAEQFISEVEK